MTDQSVWPGGAGLFLMQVWRTGSKQAGGGEEPNVKEADSQRAKYMNNWDTKHKGMSWKGNISAQTNKQGNNQDV